MKLKEAYGHPSYNRLIKAFHNQRMQLVQVPAVLNHWCKRWLADKSECDKCKKKWV